MNVGGWNQGWALIYFDLIILDTLVWYYLSYLMIQILLYINLILAGISINFCCYLGTANHTTITPPPNFVEIATKGISEETGLPKWAVYTIAICMFLKWSKNYVHCLTLCIYSDHSCNFGNMLLLHKKMFPKTKSK